MNIKELKTELERLKSMGYTIDIQKIIEENLKAHIYECYKKYNVMDMDIPVDTFTFYKEPSRHHLKDFNEIEEEIRDFFGKFNETDKINEIIKNLHFYQESSYDLSHDARSVELLRKHNKHWLIRLHPDKVVVKVYFDRWMKGKYSFSQNTEWKNNIVALFKIMFRFEPDLSFIAYSVDDSFFKTYDVGIFKFRFYKNGKVEIIGEPKYIARINQAIIQYYARAENETLVV